MMNSIKKIPDIDLFVFSFITSIFWIYSNEIAAYLAHTSSLANDPRYLGNIMLKYKMLLYSVFSAVGLMVVIRKVYIKYKFKKMKGVIGYSLLALILLLVSLGFAFTALAMYPFFYALYPEYYPEIEIKSILEQSR